MNSRKTPNSLRSRVTSSREAKIAPRMQAGSPSRVHHSTACFSMSLFLAWPHKAGRAQQTKYRRLIPPACCCVRPETRVSHKISRVPPPIPKPESTPVSAPARRERNHIIGPAPPERRRIKSAAQRSGAEESRAFFERSSRRSARRSHRRSDKAERRSDPARPSRSKCPPIPAKGAGSPPQRRQKPFSAPFPAIL